MNMITNLHGRLRNTSLPKSSGLMPLFEAVVNSIHSIEEAKLGSSDGKISVYILRKQQAYLPSNDGTNKPGPTPLEDIIGFKIVDNGIGFNNENMKSFETLDSEHKADKGCRGIGRLLWLKAFQKVEVESHYLDDDSCLKLRKFSFNSKTGVSDPITVEAQSASKKETSVYLDGFIKKYQQASRKTAEAIANSLFEHCLWYFVKDGGAPEITIIDDQEKIELENIYEKHMSTSAVPDSVTIKDQSFELTHVRLRANSQKPHFIALCAANRLVKEESIAGKIPGLYGRISDANGDYIYACYVSSKFLDENVRSEITSFDISENTEELFEDAEISLSQIREAVITKAQKHLSDNLVINVQKGKERIEKFVSTRAPRYRPILSRIPENRLSVDPNISDKDLDIMLHKFLSEIEENLLSEGHDLMKPKDDETLLDYEKRLQIYLNTAEDIKKSDLANYVYHRKVILDILSQSIKRDTNGRYAKEDLIHNLIMPMRKQSNDIMSDDCNLWIIDERLAFHNYLASDKTLKSMPITGSSELKEPDICILNVFDNPLLVSDANSLPLASIVVIEIKRPMRNDASQGEDKDPIEQVLNYIDQIRQGKVSTSSGRRVPESNNIPGFCYVLCDITPSMQSRCKMHNLKVTSDGLGYFGYNDNYKAYIEVISFDRLVNSANERNKAFFDKLGLPTN